MKMSLIIERHPSDTIIKYTKIKVAIDKKLQCKLSPGEKAEFDVSEGKHKIDCTLNLIKGSMEFDYPKDNYLVISYCVSPVGISIQSKSTEQSEQGGTVDADKVMFQCQSAINGNVGELTVTEGELLFKEIGKESRVIKYSDIRTATSSLGNLAVCLYSDITYTFMLSKDLSDSILTFVKSKVDESFRELHKGFDLSFGVDDRIFVNEADETFYVVNKGRVLPIYKLEQIISYNMGEIATKQNYFGDAAIGTLIDGQRGAFMGALHAVQQGNKVDAVKLNLTIKTDTDVVALSLDFSTFIFAKDKSSTKYNESINECSRFIAFMNDYTKRKALSTSKSECDKQVKSSNIDVAEELRKYKKLFDDGIIDEEEFKAKKSQLLQL